MPSWIPHVRSQAPDYTFGYRGERGDKMSEGEHKTEVPMEFVSDGRSAAFSYVYDGDLVQSAWGRSQ